MTSYMKKWRDAAALILMAKQSFIPSKLEENMNYKLLTMKRSTKSRVMPNTRVFPGGTLDKTDCSLEWLNLYKKFGIDNKKFDIFTKIKYIAPIFKSENDKLLSRPISLRICAIRETFEECGILLCKKADQENNGNVSLWTSYFNEFDIKIWQERVHNDPTQFIEMCYKFKIYPDIWALHLWSNWLTPSSMANRFDTVFFLANIQNNLSTFADDSEVGIIEWIYLYDILQKESRREINAPSLFYEISRLQNFSKIEELAQFSATRSATGIKRMLPQTLTTNNVTVSIFPGDDLYPGEEQSELSINNILNNIPEKEIMHRMYHLNDFTHKLIIKNYKDEIDHTYPKQQESKRM